MNRGRRSVAAVTAAAVITGAAALGALHWILGIVVDRQRMSLAGVSPTTMTVSTWTAGALLAVFLLLCAAALARTAATDRPPGRYRRAALIGCAVLHAVLGALSAALLGWWVFTAVMTVFGLVVLTLTMYPPVAPAASSLVPQLGDGDAETAEQRPQQGH
ncbi:hypothetical protein ACFVUW_07415 [Streptomyces xiamenensis]|uniref:hypothetical protein n=1 Tax=Streptomyces xiamenensis TaxID=408015 RepID=UPI0036F0C9AC